VLISVDVLGPDTVDLPLAFSLAFLASWRSLIPSGVGETSAFIAIDACPLVNLPARATPHRLHAATMLVICSIRVKQKSEIVFGSFVGLAGRAENAGSLTDPAGLAKVVWLAPAAPLVSLGFGERPFRRGIAWAFVTWITLYWRTRHTSNGFRPFFLVLFPGF